MKKKIDIFRRRRVRLSALDAAAARLGLLRTIVDDTGAALPTGGGVGARKLRYTPRQCVLLNFDIVGYSSWEPAQRRQLDSGDDHSPQLTVVGASEGGKAASI